MSTSKVFAKISEKHPVWILNQNTVTYSSSHYQPKVFSQINICYTQWCSIFVSVLVFVFVFLSQQYICQLLEGRLRESAQLQINSLLTLSSNNSSSKPLNPLILHIFKIVRTSTFVCHKKTVFEAGFFLRKSSFDWLQPNEDPPVIDIVGKLWISAFSWYFWRLFFPLQSVRIFVTLWE